MGRRRLKPKKNAVSRARRPKSWFHGHFFPLQTHFWWFYCSKWPKCTTRYGFLTPACPFCLFWAVLSLVCTLKWVPSRFTRHRNRTQMATLLVTWFQPALKFWEVLTPHTPQKPCHRVVLGPTRGQKWAENPFLPPCPWASWGAQTRAFRLSKVDQKHVLPTLPFGHLGCSHMSEARFGTILGRLDTLPLPTTLRMDQKRREP